MCVVLPCALPSPGVPVIYVLFDREFYEGCVMVFCVGLILAQLI